MISVENLSIEFAARPLFSGAQFVVNPRDRIALVGKNGAGKSTLLKMLAGEQEPTAGTVAVQKGISVGYLPQVMVLTDDVTVEQEAEKAFGHLHEAEAHLRQLEQELAERTDYESEAYLDLCQQLTLAQERHQMMGGADYRAQIDKTLTGLGFLPSDLTRPTREFSGGWRMRIELAKLLLMRPDVLLLDEPTNHLDIDSIRWLEQYLTQVGGAVVLVSHDRAFINNVTNRTLEISCGKIIDYRVRYDEYLQLRAERRESQLRAWENQQKEIADLKDFIERFRYKPTKSNQVQSRIKQLEKIVPVEIDEVDNASLHLKFPPCLRSSDYPVVCDEVEKSYGAHQVFSRVNLTIKRGEKVAFVGRNGEGKSTLVKCIMQEITHGGSLKIGHNVHIGYYAQNQAQLLDESLTVFDTIDHAATGDIRLKIRDILGAFMFGGEASDKKVKVLSGGERSRLAMIQLLLQPVNLLILDEPTNHLDMRTKDVLKEAIRAFDGTAIIVSHDREFLDGLVDKVYAFGGGKVREHLGGIYDYLQTLESVQAPTMAQPQASSVPQASSTQGAQSYAEQKELAKARKRLERAAEEAEALVGKLEAEKAALEERMAGGEASSQVFEEYAAVQHKLEAAVEEWEKAIENLG